MINGTQISIKSARPAKFSQGFRRSKIFAAIAAAIWAYGLLELVIASILKGPLFRIVLVAIAPEVGIALVAFLYFRNGMTPWKSASSCHTGSNEGGCSQVGCDSASGGCLAKLNKEVAIAIAEMERYKLSQLVRRKVGIDVALPVFWILVGIKESMAAQPALVFGGVVVSLGALGLLLSRLYLGAVVFD